MNRVLILLVALNLALAGCSKNTEANKADAGQEKDASTGEKTGAGGSGVALTPNNTAIEFVGTHSGDKPDPRKGGFKKFSGTATVADKALKAIKIEIETESLYTEIDKLTNHLKSPDFFDVRQHPKATFESTSIEPDGDGKVKITGKLTLLKETQEVSFPATIDTADGLKLDAAFTIDRTAFGMTYGEGQVEKDVAMTVRIGDK